MTREEQRLNRQEIRLIQNKIDEIKAKRAIAPAVYTAIGLLLIVTVGAFCTMLIPA